LIENQTILKRDKTRYHGKLRILWLSRMDYPKEPEILLHALEKLDRNSYTCRIIGTGPKELECRNFANNNNLTIDFLPEANVIAELRNADVFVLMSKFEGLPFVLQEALAMGVAVACSRLPGTEFLGGEDFQYANDSTQLLEILLSLMNPSNLILRKKLVENRWNLIYPKLNSNWSSSQFTLPRRGAIK
jgi:glycosyltransferase involved in cell wall biosynthesis